MSLTSLQINGYWHPPSTTICVDIARSDGLRLFHSMYFLQVEDEGRGFTYTVEGEFGGQRGAYEQEVEVPDGGAAAKDGEVSVATAKRDGVGEMLRRDGAGRGNGTNSTAMVDAPGGVLSFAGASGVDADRYDSRSQKKSKRGASQQEAKILATWMSMVRYNFYRSVKELLNLSEFSAKTADRQR
ncbi:uncharacterized protein KY384_006758 [Bacidia gigantensis]|uniref:uncharacterized protein n=1 Tax=Bacidia gigantensis TaxID=2732470 RepID=UPI001D0596AC|nr:uncharacterized protein KY384_006758 [Bacidia gigantensis]KAG8527842.1 hypothetical protein KY384_006758 [Bacidia gigantensis]